MAGSPPDINVSATAHTAPELLLCWFCRRLTRQLKASYHPDRHAHLPMLRSLFEQVTQVGRPAFSESPWWAGFCVICSLHPQCQPGLPLNAIHHQ